MLEQFGTKCRSSASPKKCLAAFNAASFIRSKVAVILSSDSSTSARSRPGYAPANHNNLPRTLSKAFGHRDGNNVRLAHSDARHRKKGSASIVSAAMHTNSPTPSAITMSPIVSIASPLHISETAKIPFARAMQTNLPSARSGRGVSPFAKKRAISFFSGDSPTDDGACGMPMPRLYRWRSRFFTSNWDREYGRHAAPPRHEACKERLALPVSRRSKAAQRGVARLLRFARNQIATDVAAVALRFRGRLHLKPLTKWREAMSLGKETPRLRRWQRGVFFDYQRREICQHTQIHCPRWPLHCQQTPGNRSDERRDFQQGKFAHIASRCQGSRQFIWNACKLFQPSDAFCTVHCVRPGLNF